MDTDNLITLNFLIVLMSEIKIQTKQNIGPRPRFLVQEQIIPLTINQNL